MIEKEERYSEQRIYEKKVPPVNKHLKREDVKGEKEGESERKCKL